MRSKSREWLDHNKERAAETTKKYRQRNAEKISARNYKKYREVTLPKLLIMRAQRPPPYRLSPEVRRIKDRVRHRMNYALRAFRNRGLSVPRTDIKHIGCTIPELMRFLELKFDSSMSWDNYGTYWHIDHIKPVAAFDLTDEAECKVAFHYQNLQPMEAVANRNKKHLWWPEYTQLLFLF